MADLGTVNILISGDYSRLQADFATAQAMAGRAGAQISTALNSSFAPGMKTASGLVDQFGRSIAALAPPTEAATARKVQFAAATREAAAASARMSAIIAEEAQQYKTLVLWANLAAAAQKGNAEAGDILGGKKDKERTSFVGAIPGFGVAAERFIGMIPGLGPALIAAFPVFGALALLQVLFQLGDKVIDLYRSVGDAKEKIGGAFRDASIGVRTANDELRVTNDRVANTIAKLEGRPQNNLKLALDEAVVSADKLASSLAKDLEAVYKILEENKVGLGTAILSAQRPTGDLSEEAGGRTGKGGFNANVARVAEDGRSAVRAATTEDAKRAAQMEMNIRLTRLYEAEIKKLSAQLYYLPNTAIVSSAVRLALNQMGVPINTGGATATAEELIKGRIANLKQQQEAIPLHAENDDQESKQKRIEDGRRSAGDSARTELARITNRMAASVRVYDAERKQTEQTIALSHQEAQSRIEAITAPSSRAIAEADEEVRIATERAAKLGALNQAETEDRINQIEKRSKFDQAGKDPQAASASRIAAEGEVAAARSSAAQKDIDLQGAVALATAKSATVRITEGRKVAAEMDKEVREGFQLLDREWKEALARGEKYAEQQGLIMTRVWEIEARSRGNVKATQTEGRQIDVETQLRTTPGLTLQNQVGLMQQLAQLDQDQIAERRAGLTEELTIARTIEDEGRGKIEVARIQAQINQLDADGANVAKRAQAEILELKYRQSFAAKLDQAGRQLPGQIGGALAKGVTGGGKIGQDITQALKGAGQQLLGTVFEAAIKQLVVQLGISAAIQTLLGTIFSTGATAQVAAQTANTAALIANTTAQAAQSGVGAASAGIGAAGSAASVATKAASSAASAATGGLLAGVVSGVIAAAGSIIGAVLIVRAIHQTTAAVNALRRSGVASSRETKETISQKDDAEVKSASVFDSIGKFFGGEAVRVNVVAISPMAFTNGLFGTIGDLLGFADGGRPPVGVPSMVGENGPELFIPGQAGRIIPHHQLGAYMSTGTALGAPMQTGGAAPNIFLPPSSPSEGAPGGPAAMMAAAMGGSTSNSNSIGAMHFNVSGASNPRETAREIASYLKSTSNRYQTRG